MLSIREHATVEEAAERLLRFALEPGNWVELEHARRVPSARPGQIPAYQRQVGRLRICACIIVTRRLESYLRVSFRATGLTPSSAADHLAAFLIKTLPLRPGAEWQVDVDSGWVHFQRRWAPGFLVA